jgi:hypothetical protein
MDGRVARGSHPCRRRPDLEALFNSPDLPYPKNRRRALRYIEEFYEIVNEGGETAPT